MAQEYFSQTVFGEDDLIEAMEYAGIRCTTGNLTKLRDACKYDISFDNIVYDAGWKRINWHIEQLLDTDQFEEESPYEN